MNEEKIKEIVEKVISDNMPNKDEITQKAIEAVKGAVKKENDKPWLIKEGEEYCLCDIMGNFTIRINAGDSEDKHLNLIGLVARTKDELREVIKARKMQREYEQWCMEYPVDWGNSEQGKFGAIYDYSSNKIVIWDQTVCKSQGATYCASWKHIKSFINKVGEPNFIKYIIGIGLPKYFLEV